MTITHLQPPQWDEAAQLVHAALDTWYRLNLNIDRFGSDWEPYRVFTEIYEALDPGRCLVAVGETGRLLGCIFYHPRETHVGIGVVATHPSAGKQGVARALLEYLIQDAGSKPLRLVSSALNLESFSLYTKLGFVPHATFQDVSLAVPETGLTGVPVNVRSAVLGDAARMADLEFRLNGIRRQHDYDFFLTNTAGYWHTLVVEDAAGKMIGFLNACGHPASRILGPGVSVDAATMQQLIHAMLDQHFRSATVIWLVPVNCPPLVQQAYQWGARNLEIHLASTLGAGQPLLGITIPTFMPESG